MNEHMSRFKRLSTWLLIIGFVLLALSASGLAVNSKQFFHSYLISFVFWWTLSLGGLFFTLLHHLFSARWSVLVIRFYENLMLFIPFLLLLFVPVVLGMKDLYHWTHAEEVANDLLLSEKAPYLNIPFFTIRLFIYFAIWSLLSRYFFKKSLLLDKGYDSLVYTRLRQISAPAMILFALTLTFASFDWIMSLDAHWYSTIFGVYVFSGSALGTLAFVLLAVFVFREQEPLRRYIQSHHVHDLGKMLFTFTVFWAYIAFSQYFLIWYGNIPEETIWYGHRWQGSWQFVSLLIVFGHFVVPFLILLPQKSKKNIKLLAVLSIWLLGMHWIDLYWLIMPNLHHHSVHLSWMDLSLWVSMGFLVIGFFARRLTLAPMLAINDPRLVKPEPSA